MNRWSGKLATASDPYFQNPPGSPMSCPRLPQPLIPVPEMPSLDFPPKPPIPILDPIESNDTAPSTPQSIGTSTGLDIEEYFGLLDEDDDEDHYNNDPSRLERDLEINERVNCTIAEAEEAVLAREILSLSVTPTERKTVQFAMENNQTRVVEDYVTGDDKSEAEILTKIVYVWNTFRDFATASSVTGFEEFVLEPRMVRNSKKVVDNIETGGENIEETVGGGKNGKSVEIVPGGSSGVGSSTASTNDVLGAPVPHATQIPAMSTQTMVNILDVAPQKSEASLLDLPPSEAPSWSDWNNLLDPPVTTVETTPTPVPIVSSHDEPKPTRLVTSKLSPTQIREIKLTTSIKPEFKPRSKLSMPVTGLKDERADVENTWDMPMTPLVRIDMEKSDCPRREVENKDPFLAGLSASKKIEAISKVTKDAVIEESNRVTMSKETKAVPLKSDPIKAPPEVAPGPAESQVIHPSTVPGPSTFDAIGGSIPSPTNVSGIQSSAPIPPTQRPAIRPPVEPPVKPILVGSPATVLKTPTVTKPIVSPKPTKLASRPKSQNVLSPVVGGLVDPFLAGLQPISKKDPPARPKTPATSTASAEPNPKKLDSSSPGQKNSNYTPPDASVAGSSPPSPTSLSSSWTMVEKTKKEAPASGLASVPVRKTWFGADTRPIPPTSAPIPVVVQPSVTLVKPPCEHITTMTKPINPLQGRKLFTFELKVGSSIISTPIYELDNPRIIAEQFAREHDLESRLPDGKAVVEKIIGYFEAQFVERKAEREKRRAERRERTKIALSGE